MKLVVVCIAMSILDLLSKMNSWTDSISIHVFFERVQCAGPTDIFGNLPHQMPKVWQYEVSKVSKSILGSPMRSFLQIGDMGMICGHSSWHNRKKYVHLRFTVLITSSYVSEKFTHISSFNFLVISCFYSFRLLMQRVFCKMQITESFQ